MESSHETLVVLMEGGFWSLFVMVMGEVSRRRLFVEGRLQKSTREVTSLLQHSTLYRYDFYFTHKFFKNT